MKRRSFFVKTSIGLGVFFGASVLGCGPLRRVIAKQVDETTLPYKNDDEPTVWFQITPQNDLIIYSPKVEMGQGIFTALAQIAAEELEVDWQKIKVVHASTSHGPIDVMSTGGSLTVSGLFTPLRELAAQMREMLKLQASKLFAIPVVDLTAKNGMVTAKDQSITYGEIATKTKKWENVPTPTLKAKKDWQYIGKALPRIDLKDKVMGLPIYGIDADFPDMLFGSVLRPPVFGATLQSATAGAASNMPGVVKVVIDKDLVAVVAKSRFEAEAAKRKIDIQWKLPNKLFQQADIENIIKVRSGKKVVIQKEGSTHFKDKVIEYSYSSPLGAHAHIEPNGASAAFEGEKLIVKLSTQVSNLTRQQVAEALGMNEENVDIQSQYLGGGFGRRLATPHAIEAAKLAKAVGKPVHVFWERAEEFQNGYLRPPTAHTLHANLDQSGKITSLEHHTASADVAFNSAILPAFIKPIPGGLAKTLVGADFGAWRGGMIHYHGIENYKTIAYHHELPFPTSWWRGLGLLANTFAIESFMDEIAHSTNQDPLMFRIKHLGIDQRGQSMKRVLEAVAKASNWQSPKTPGVGRGLACSFDVTVPVAQVAEIIMVDGTLKVNKVYCALDPCVAINPDGIKAQVEGAINMGLSAALYEAVKIKDGAVENNGFGFYQMASIKDAPAIEVIILESEGAPKGIGEPPIGPIAAAIANAIFDLTGQRHRSLPFISA